MKRLFVIVHGLSGGGRPANFDPLIERLGKEPGLKEDVVEWCTYPRRLWALGFESLANFARDLAAWINGRWIMNNGFDDVVLIGHSVGGLLVRQAYLEAIGSKAWARKVTRIVLLAAPNRGVPGFHGISSRSTGASSKAKKYP
jgi:triacylglycerol esterase/lipase EstA (alpha/beta hydrolase family)